MEIPYKIRSLPDCLQRVWRREWQRVLENTGSAITAVKAADSLIEAVTVRSSLVDADDSHSEHSVSLSAVVCELAETRAKDILPDSVLNAVKAETEHPFLTLFEVGTPGVSTGEGVRKIWSFGAIKELAKKMAEGAASIFYKHTDEDDSTREELGKIVWGFVRKVGKELKAYAVGLITDKLTQERIQSGELDLCSIEGQVQFQKRGAFGDWFIEKVNNVTGLVLANSVFDKPGFASAGPVAIIRELERKGSMMAEEKQNTSMSVADVDIATVKVAIETHGWRPEQLFRTEDLLDVASIQEHIKTELEKAKKETEDAVKKLQDELEPLKIKDRQQTVAVLIEKSSLLTDKKEGCRKYIVSHLGGLSLDGVEAELRQTKVDDAVKKELEQIKNLGITFADKTEEETEETSTEEETTSGKKKIDRSDMARSWADGGGNKQIPSEES